MPFRLPTRIICAEGAIDRVAEIIEIHRKRRILLVVDAGLSATPWPAKVIQSLSNAGYSTIVFDEVEQNPRYATIDRIGVLGRSEEVELVIALGGGSVLDAGKAAAMLLQNAGSCLDYVGRNRFTGGSAPFVAIPTTCGTGSEVTWVSVISHPVERRKLSVKGEAMFPDDAIVDASLLRTLPAHLIAYTGMDAFTHAIEAYTCNCGNPISDALAEQAIRLLHRYLERCFRDIEDEEARFEVMRASTLAGMAFGNADVAGVHCLSESIGGLYDVPHGLANAILLSPVMRFHSPFITSRLAGLYRAIHPDAKQGEEVLCARMIDRIEQLVISLNIPAFSSLNIAPESYSEIANASVRNNSNGSNPRQMREAEYLSILEGLA